MLKALDKLCILLLFVLLLMLFVGVDDEDNCGDNNTAPGWIDLDTPYGELKSS